MVLPHMRQLKLKFSITIAYFLFVKSFEEFDDICGGADVDEQQLRELIVREFSLRKHPSSEDENQQQQLLQRPYPVTILDRVQFDLPGA